MPAGAAGDIVSGADYVSQITALESDRRARATFQSLVLSLAPPGGALFDFGAGPGIDARFYAERGFSVAAYDVDPQMCEYFAAHCRGLMEAGRIRLERGSYRDFLARSSVAGGRDVDLVTANFAPLNLVDDLRGLFAAFHALAAPNGKVLASVLSPYFIGDLKYGWWWRNVLRLWRDGHYSVPGSQGPIVRRRLADFAAQSEPYFSLQRVFPGLPPTPPRHSRGRDATGRCAWLSTTRCLFMFLLFEKLAQGGRAARR
jgi:SAM-dependent methyltransferase